MCVRVGFAGNPLLLFRDAHLSGIGCTLCGTDRRGVTLSRNVGRGAARGDLKDALQNRDVPGGRDSDFREEDWFSPVVDARARYVAPRGSDRAGRTTLARASLIIISGRFLDPEENLSRARANPTSPTSRPLSHRPSVVEPYSRAGIQENNLSHASRNSKRSPRARARKTCRWNVTCRRLFRSRMTEVKGGSLVSTGDTYPGILPRRFSHPG